MAKLGKILAGIGIGLSLLCGYKMSTFTIKETEQAIVTLQGRPERVYVGSFEAGQPDLERIASVREWADANGYGDVEIYSTDGVLGTGLQFKIPLLENVVKIPDQLLQYNADLETVQTLGNTQLVEDNYAKFYIENPLMYYLKVGDINGAMDRMDDTIYSALRDNMGKHKYNENIRTTDRTVMSLDGEVSLSPVTYGRDKILDDIVSQSHAEVEGLGLNLVDVRFIRVELPDMNKPSIYERMISERDRIAALYTAEGNSKYQEITSDADKQAEVIRANALENEGTLLGEAEAEAARIYTEASQKDPEFFRFWRTMKSYGTAFEGGSTDLILTTDSAFNQYLNSVTPLEPTP